MLELKEIVKCYGQGDNAVVALNGVSLNFRKSEFVSILGASGCGKTTLLNIIGGLDRYTSGYICINGVSTKKYKDSDWDVYRNHSVGFVFQSYNLISHLTVLENVEMALNIGGESSSTRREKAMNALKKVGLEGQAKKHPNQLSGGQMQRVAIARALITDPEIILADEPTGALDSVTSIQVMDLLKEVAKERLVIMVTHNPELAEKYSTRIITLKDGKVEGDTDPYEIDKTKENKVISGKTSMSFFTALKSSLKNLISKRARTTLTCIAGSIGIIGIALILSVSNGLKTYMHNLQVDSLSEFPISIAAIWGDMDAMFGLTSSGGNPSSSLDKIMGEGHNKFPDDDEIYPFESTITSMLSKLVTYSKIDEEFMAYVENIDPELINAVQYMRTIEPHVVLKNSLGMFDYCETCERFVSLTLGEIEGVCATCGSVASGEKCGKCLTWFTNSNVRDKKCKTCGTAPVSREKFDYSLLNATDAGWQELLNNEDYMKSQYDVINKGGVYPSKADEIAIVVDSYNRLNTRILDALGVAYVKAGTDENGNSLGYPAIPFEEFLGLELSMIYNDTYYAADEKGVYKESVKPYEEMYKEGKKLKVTAILRSNPDASARWLSSGVAYTQALTDETIEIEQKSKIVKAQEAAYQKYLSEVEAGNENAVLIDVKTGSKMTNEWVNILELAKTFMGIQTDEIINITPETMYLEAMRKIGGTTLPSVVFIYPSSFENKAKVIEYLKAYNEGKEKEDQIVVNDATSTMIGMVQGMIEAISYVLIAFSAISLLVSSVMIGIITYVSVMERTKEIGVLRAMGARKIDITRIFNAETLMIGTTSGLLAIIVAYILDLVISLILKALTGIPGLAVLSPLHALILVGVSIFLTVVSGLIPAIFASKKDPVVALRSE